MLTPEIFLLLSTAKAIHSMDILKKIGERGHPCLTPRNIDTVPIAPFTLIFETRRIKMKATHDSIKGRRRILFIAYVRKGHSTQSNAFTVSTKNSNVGVLS